MLRFILYDTTMFDDDDDVERTRKTLIWCMEALVQRNQEYLKQRPKTPRLYKSGVCYAVPQQFAGECDEVQVLKRALGRTAKRGDVAAVLRLIQEVFGGERFRDIGRILENGGGDCDNLSCWRVAELRQAGVAARPYMTHRPRFGGGTTYHALVLWPPHDSIPYETSEDPSLLLGMGGESRVRERLEEIRKDVERSDILRARAAAPVAVADASLDAVLSDVLGIRRAPRARSQAPDALAAIEDALRSVAA